MKRFVYLAHRWLGIGLSLFMLLWFLSGLVMIYADSGSVSPQQNLAHSPPLQLQPEWPTLQQAWQRQAIPAADIASARLQRQGDETVWLVQDSRGQRHALSAQNGAPLATDPARALAIARSWQPAGSPAPTLLATVQRDAATAMMSYDAYRPFHRIALHDRAGTELYISARSGEVLRASDRIGRLLFWSGSYLHFLRPLDALGLGDARKAILTWGALLGVIAVISGIWVGLGRWRPGWFGQRRYPDGRSNPYRAPWPKWHLWLGLGGGLLALTWIVSGFVANNPWQLFSTRHQHPAAASTYQGGALPASARNVPVASLLASLDASQLRDVVALRWFYLGEQAVLYAYQRNGARHELLRHGAAAASPAEPVFALPVLLAAVQRRDPASRIQSQQWLTQYDDYYYPPQRGSGERPLPVLRVKLDDAAASWLYQNPATGELVAQFDQRRRIYRWLFNGLHSWDMGWLKQRPLWDIWMVLGSLAGIALGTTSLLLAGRRLRRKFAPHAKAAARPQRAPDPTPPPRGQGAK